MSIIFGSLIAYLLDLCDAEYVVGLIVAISVVAHWLLHLPGRTTVHVKTHMHARRITGAEFNAAWKQAMEKSSRTLK